jgi:hypothetical protein
MGHSADGENTYAAVSDVSAGADAQPGVSALKLATGEKVWSTPVPKVTCAPPAACSPSQSAAVSVIPDADFSGALNGHFRAYSTKTGEIIWDFDTARPSIRSIRFPARVDRLTAQAPPSRTAWYSRIPPTARAGNCTVTSCLRFRSTGSSGRRPNKAGEISTASLRTFVRTDSSWIDLGCVHMAEKLIRSRHDLGLEIVALWGISGWF